MSMKVYHEHIPKLSFIPSHLCMQGSGEKIMIGSMSSRIP